jgi:hypothetical protein
MDGRRTFATVFLGQLLCGGRRGRKDFERLLTPKGRRDLLTPSPDGRRSNAAVAAYRAPHDRGLFDLIAARGELQ